MSLFSNLAMFSGVSQKSLMLKLVVKANHVWFDHSLLKIHIFEIEPIKLLSPASTSYEGMRSITIND